MTSKRMYSFGPRMSRRRFVAGAAAVAGAAGLAGTLPESLANAATGSPATFDLSQVKHLVFLMQENRSFDHYFGAFPGARGFGDPTAIRLPNGNSVFQQPFPGDADGYLEPWHMSTVTSGAAALPTFSNDWRDQHASWNDGYMDSWLLTHVASAGFYAPLLMGYFTGEDIPFHWALAQSFTLLDNYHCSMLGSTDPNRLLWETGSVDPQGLAGGPVLIGGTGNLLTYESGPETLYAAGVSYKYYASNHWTYPEQISYSATGNYMHNFSSPSILPAALYNSVQSRDTLFGDGTPGGIGDPANPTAASTPGLAFEEDCANGVLPDVSFLGTAASEHPNGTPASGAQYIAQVLDALAANDELWNTTVFVLNWDENDGLFDHVVPPTPNPEEYPEEFITKADSYTGEPGGGLPVGAGFRVPAMIISPWTVGGRIFSQVSDHTSCLRLIEAVAAAGGLSGKGPVHFPYVSRWRRKTFGDLTAALPPGTPQPAPANTQFDPATREANFTAQATASEQPLPAPPSGTTQDFPYPLPGPLPIE